MIPDVAREFTDRAHTLFGKDLLSVILVGSFARDDERPDSDIDLFVLVTDAGVTKLPDVGKLVQSIKTLNEINPAIVSENEFIRFPDMNELLKIRHDGVILFGQLPHGLVPEETEIRLARRIAHEVLMSSRHYLAVAEPRDSFRSGKLWTYNIKPLSFAARFYHFDRTGQYIRRFDDIKRVYPVLALDPVTEHDAVIDGCAELALEILRT